MKRMEEGDLMSMNEAERYRIIKRVLEREITQVVAAAQLQRSVRQIKRLCKSVRALGIQAVISKKRGKPSKRRIAPLEQQRVIEVIREHYADFGPELAGEYLRKEHSFTASTETLRQWMIEAKLWRPKQRRAKRVHSPRARRARFGELVQIDGSHHDWFEGRGAKCCLIAFIDDATGRVCSARFSPTESTQDYFEVLRRHIGHHGVPLALYSDRHGIFTKSDSEDPDPTQFERALIELRIEPIQARTPQAKGRVERLFQTLQDRMCKAMRLAKVSDIASANAWLEGYLSAHNERFAVAARESADAHRPWAFSQEQLARICAKHHTRQLGVNLSCQFEGRVVQVHAKQEGLPQGKAQVGVVQYADDRLEIIYRTKVLENTCYELHPHLRNKRAVDDKTLNTKVDEIVLKAQRQIGKLMVQIEHQNAQRAQGMYKPATAANAMPA